MALIDRLARLFKADFHAVLDRIEEPEVLLKRAIREMEDELSASERRICALQLEQRQLLQRQSGIEQSLARLDEELGVCFDSGSDDLARALIKRKLEAQMFLRALGRHRETLEKTLHEQQARLDENRAQFDGMRQQAELLSAEAMAPGPGEFQFRAAAEFRVDEADVEVAMLREKQLRGRKFQTASSAKE
jgi:phage shock protein A